MYYDYRREDDKEYDIVDPKTGKVLQLAALKHDPKSEITLWKNSIVGFATEADLMKALKPSGIFYDLKSVWDENKFIKKGIAYLAL